MSDTNQKLPQDRRAELLRHLEVKKEGFAGILPSGRLVDRREHPEAAPIAANPLLGVPEPKQVPATIPRKEPLPPKLTPTEMRQALERLRSAAEGDDTHTWEVRVSLGAALDDAKRSEKQSLCPHSRRPIFRCVGQADYHDCPDCGKSTLEKRG